MNKTLEQNAKVWARRLDANLGANADVREKAVVAMGLNPSSRKTAIFVVLRNLFLDTTGKDRELSATMAWIAAAVVYGFVYDNMEGNVLKNVTAKMVSTGNVLPPHRVVEMVDAVNKAISARTKEYSQPSLANVVLGQVGGRQVNIQGEEDWRTFM